AETHGVTYHSLGRGHVGDVTVTGGTLDLVAYMWRVIEPDVRNCREPIHTLPRNIFVALLVIGNFLELRLIVRHVLVAFPTFINGRNFGHRAFVNTFVTIDAFQLHLQDVHSVGVFDRLHRLRTDVEKLTKGGG